MLHGGKRLGRFTCLQYVARTQWSIRWCQQQQQRLQRGLLTLAIETSCDDTAVAIVETTGSLDYHHHHHHHHHHNQHHRHRASHLSSNISNADADIPIHHNTSNIDKNSSHHPHQNTTTTTLQLQSSTAIDSPPPPPSSSTTHTTSQNDTKTSTTVQAKILFHEKITASNTGHGGIHPIEALESHQANLATLVSKAIAFLPDANANANATPPEVENGARRTFQYHCQPSSPLTAPSLDHGRQMTKKKKILPDFVTVTRGPGMRSNLACGLDTAKGLAAAWQVPLVGVHHMQAHALTPRLVDALERGEKRISEEQKQEQEQRRLLEGVKGENCMDVTKIQSSSSNLPPTVSKSKDQIQTSQPQLQLQQQLQPQFPFLTLLISGGHTMLVYSKGLIDHRILATTRDIAIGDALDKCGRVILPEKVQSDMQDTAYAKCLSEWASDTSQSTELWPVPRRRQFEIDKPINEFGWQVQTPLADTRDLAFSFTGIATGIEKLFKERNNSVDTPITDPERLMFARTALGISFEHLGSRTIIALENLRAAGNDISTLVVSGGVAANSFLRLFLRSMLNVRGFEHVKLLFPPPWLCTDNAVMIAWSGIEMFEAGFQSQADIRALRRWSMDPTAAEGGILGVGGWMQSALLI